MSEKVNYSHLDFEKRCAIEKYLNQGMSLSFIAENLVVPLSTVSREVKRNRRDDGFMKIEKVTHVCKHRRNCAVRALCKEKHCRRRKCATCHFVLCTSLCQHYEADVCQRTKRAPYVCNGCIKPWGCRLHRFRYDAKCAQRMADTRLKDTRCGINSTEEEFSNIIDTVKPLLKSGLGLDAIWCEHKETLGISKRTFYRWADLGLDVCNMDLPKKVAYRPRKKKSVATETRPELTGRQYADFMALPEEVRMSAFEMDCVEGLKSDKQVILTLLHRRTHFQFGVLLKRHDAASVVQALNWVESICAGKFHQLFSVILTDRGHEFLDISGMEMDAKGKRRCKVYFCDPQRPDQKGQCERAHVDLRKILPKRKTSFDNLTPLDMAKIFSHINSVPRPSLSGATPMALAKAVFAPEFFDGTGLSFVALKDICLKPRLIDRREGGL